MNVKRTTGLLAPVVAVCALAACAAPPPASPAAPPAAAGSDSGSQASTAHNEADVAFVKGMIPHHAQAVQMSGFAADRAASQQVKDLATTIFKAQGPEIGQMLGLLRVWDPPAAPTTSGGTGGLDRGGMSGDMPGTAGEQMTQPRDAKGASFDRMFLQMMIEHHTGAIAMSETELRDGENTDAKTLAQKIIDAQRAEIDQMRELLKTT